MWPVTPSASDGQQGKKGERLRPKRQTLASVETTATFRLLGRTGLTAAAVTRRLSIQPTRALEAGDPVSRRSAKVRDSSAWLLASSAGIEVDTELSEHLHRLLASLEPVTALVWELVQEGYEANWFCYIASHATEHAVELDRTILQRLLALPGDLWLEYAAMAQTTHSTRQSGEPLRHGCAHSSAANSAALGDLADAITPGVFEPVPAQAAAEELRGWVSSWVVPEEDGPEVEATLAAEVLPKLDGDSILRLPGPRASAEHERGWVVGPPDSTRS
jgi:hypothetical protein